MMITMNILALEYLQGVCHGIAENGIQQGKDMRIGSEQSIAR
jgi:hypothetical protein